MLDSEQLNQLYHYGLSLTADRQEAEDLLQSALERLISQAMPPRHPLAYTRSIMRNAYIDSCRRQKVIAFEALADDEPADLDTRSLEQLCIDQDHVEKLLQQLKSGEREVLFMWAVLELTASEIAVELQQPRGTILSRLYRIRKQLQGQQDDDRNSVIMEGKR